jgi:osmotically-inducible protein OsmY
MGKHGGRWKVGLLLLAVCGCGREDADRLARVGRKTAAKFADVTAGARGKLSSGWQAVRGSLSDTTTDSRVVLRLRWEKALAGAEIQVQAPSPGVIHLQGTVADLDQRRRAVSLAESTQGVEKVVDEMTVSGP